MLTTGYTEGVARPEKEAKTPMGRWARAIRHKAGLSQRAFAEAIGIGWPGTISRWETGDQAIEIESITMIRKAFPNAPPPPIEGMSDPDRSVVFSAEKGTTVDLTEGAIVARDIDREPLILQARLRNAALNAIQEELKAIAKEAAASHQNPTELDADNKARPRPGKSSSGRGKTQT